MKVFIDTSVFISLSVKKDINYQRVKKKYQEYKQQRALFLTSDYILDELYTRLIYDFNEKVCKDRVKKLTLAEKNGEINVLRINEVLFDKALKVFLKFSEHKISFTDASTYVCVKEYKLDEIFTLDSDFKKLRLKVSP